MSRAFGASPRATSVEQLRRSWLLRFVPPLDVANRLPLAAALLLGACAGDRAARTPHDSVAEVGANTGCDAATDGARCAGQGAGDGRGSGASPDELKLRGQLEAALDHRELDALEPLARSAETLAPASGDASPLWLLAARARRERADSLAARASAAPVEAAYGSSARELLALLSAEARLCAADAHRSWAVLAPEAAAAIDAGAAPATALQPAPAAAAEPLYLEALCSAAWARAQGFTFFVAQRGLLTAALARAAALAPLLDGAGPDRELGRLFASLPAYAGGDLAQARAHFQAAIAAAPDALWNRVLFARSVAVKLQDRPLFTQLLQDALARPDNGPGAQLAKDEARSLLERGDDLFGATTATH